MRLFQQAVLFVGIVLGTTGGVVGYAAEKPEGEKVVEGEVSAGEWREVCAELADIAETLMGFRQQGIALSRILELDSYSTNEYLARLAVAAYDQPRYSTTEIQDSAISDFRDAVHVDCIKDHTQ